MATATLDVGEDLSPRIQRMIGPSRERGLNQPDDAAVFAENQWLAWSELHQELPWRERQARTWAYGIENLPVHLFPEDELVGMVYHHPPRSPQVPMPFNYWEHTEELAKEQIPELEDLVTMEISNPRRPAPAHIAWRYDRILNLGLNGLLADVRARRENPRDDRAREFYDGVLILLQAMHNWNAKHVAALDAAVDAATDPADRERLARLADICRRVPDEPPRNFHEAVQAWWFQYITVMRENPSGGNGPGRLDYYLWPWLERDLVAGRTTLADARDLIDELFMKLHERVLIADGHVETIVVGGSHPDGSSAVNPLSTIMVESIEALKQTHPAVYIRMPADPPTEFIDLAVKDLLRGHNRAQVLSDPAIMKAMQYFGMAKEDAAMYCCGGCMEINPHGMNSDLLFAGIYSVVKAVELIVTGGECLKTGKRMAWVDLPGAGAFADFDAFYAHLENEMKRQLFMVFRCLDLGSMTMAKYRPTYLMSSMVLDCLERGREQQDGGARYHDYGIAPLGIPNAGDALYALKRAVFDDRFCTFAELLAALRANFVGHEALQARLRALPKYGQSADADAMTDRLLNTVVDGFAGYRNRFGGRTKPIIFTFVWAPMIGATLGATPYGEVAGKPIAQALTPQSIAMTEGITAAIGSHTGLSLDRVAGGVSSMWDLDTSMATHDVTKALLQAFLDQGGQIFQGNTTDVQDLIKAQEHPEDYPNLLVRVGGFSARFVRLGREVQNEIITRHRHRG